MSFIYACINTHTFIGKYVCCIYVNYIRKFTYKQFFLSNNLKSKLFKIFMSKKTELWRLKLRRSYIDGVEKSLVCNLGGSSRNFTDLKIKLRSVSFVFCRQCSWIMSVHSAFSVCLVKTNFDHLDLSTLLNMNELRWAWSETWLSVFSSFT